MHGGDHVCFIYDSDAAHAATLTAFVVGGLERNERVLYFSDEQPTDQILAILESRGIDTKRHIAQGRLVVATAAESYLLSGHFDPDACIQAWLRTGQQARFDGYRGIRVAGDMGWALRDVPGAEHLLDYERRIQTEVFPSGAVTGMCEIDRRRFSHPQVRTLLGLHPDGSINADLVHSGSSLQIVRTTEPFGAKVFGEIDVGVNDNFRSALRCLGATDASDIYLDFSAVRFVAGSVLETLVQFARNRAEQGSLIVLDMAPKFRRLMELRGWCETPGLVLIEKPSLSAKEDAC